MKIRPSPALSRAALCLLSLGITCAAQAACPTANTQFKVYQADINSDGTPDLLFVPVPTVIVLPLGKALTPIMIDAGLPAFNYLSSAAPVTVAGVPASAVPVSYTSTVMAADPGSCGVVTLRGQTPSLPTLVVSFSPTAGTPPALVQTLASGTSASTKISYGYDARNRLLSTTFGDGSPAIARSYTADGLPATVAVGGSNASTWTYAYNNRRLLTQESLQLLGTSATLKRSYDANAHLAQLTYPDNSAVAYNPNALGEPT